MGEMGWDKAKRMKRNDRGMKTVVCVIGKTVEILTNADFICCLWMGVCVVVEGHGTEVSRGR